MLKHYHRRPCRMPALQHSSGRMGAGQRQVKQLKMRRIRGHFPQFGIHLSPLCSSQREPARPRRLAGSRTCPPQGESEQSLTATASQACWGRKIAPCAACDRTKNRTSSLLTQTHKPREGTRAYSLTCLIGSMTHIAPAVLFYLSL